jgi:hypothetical protein
MSSESLVKESSIPLQERDRGDATPNRWPATSSFASNASKDTRSTGSPGCHALSTPVGSQASCQTPFYELYCSRSV